MANEILEGLASSTSTVTQSKQFIPLNSQIDDSDQIDLWPVLNLLIVSSYLQQPHFCPSSHSSHVSITYTRNSSNET